MSAASACIATTSGRRFQNLRSGVLTTLQHLPMLF